MKFLWDKNKNVLLKISRGVDFDDIVTYLRDHKPLEIRKHPNEELYPHQKIYIIPLNDYIYMVPFVEDKVLQTIFLKTIIPSRKLKKEFL